MTNTVLVLIHQMTLAFHGPVKCSCLLRHGMGMRWNDASVVLKRKYHQSPLTSPPPLGLPVVGATTTTDAALSRQPITTKTTTLDIKITIIASGYDVIRNVQVFWPY